MNKILVVEDEKDIRENLKLLLSAEGYDVICSENGLAAWNTLQSKTPDLIVSDIMMPYLDGFELFRKVSEKYTEKLIPFIFLTAKNDPLSIRSGMNLGADDYLTKPFSEDELLKAINIRLTKYAGFNEQIKNVYENISKYIPHELRTPLVAIMGYTQLIKSEAESTNQNEIKEMTERITYASNRLYSRIEKFIQLMETDELTKKNLSSQKLGCTISESLLKEIVLYNYVTKEREKDFFFSLEENQINISERYLRLILNEVLENAVKFSEVNKLIKVIGKPDGTNYILEVIDYGIGMTEEESSLLGNYKQFNRETFQQEGNGLGLVIVKNVLKKFGGEIDISSEANKQTKITLIFERH